MTFYNDNDLHVCAWLRELIRQGQLPEGIIDERPIQEIEAGDVQGFQHVSLFAGIGGWQLALDLAGWSRSRLVWSGSCPCQPFSAAGKRKGQEDERHLWPEMRRLIATCLPDTIFGEQVASSDGYEWLSSVRFDLENIHYWSVFHEDLYEMRQAAKAGRIQEVLGEVIRRAEADMPRLSEEVRKILERQEPSKATGAKGEKPRKRQTLSDRIHPQKQGLLFGVTDQEAVSEKEVAIRSGQVSASAKQTDRSGKVRSDWVSAQNDARQAKLRQRVLGSDQSFCGLCLREHPRGLLCSQRRAWKLGSGTASPSDGVLAWEEVKDDERLIAAEFGSLLAIRLGHGEIARVRHDLETAGYAVGCADLPACCAGAPHIRQRLFWVAKSVRATGERDAGAIPGTEAASGGERIVNGHRSIGPGDGGATGGLELAASDGRGQGRAEPNGRRVAGRCGVSGLGNSMPDGRQAWPGHAGESERPQEGEAETSDLRCRLDDFWHNSVLIPCRDGKSRRIESGLQPLVDGVSFLLADGSTRENTSRAAALRGIGNAVVPAVAAMFIRAFLDVEAEWLGRRIVQSQDVV